MRMRDNDLDMLLARVLHNFIGVKTLDMLDH